MKTKINIISDGILMSVLNGDDAKRVPELIGNCEIVRFDCGYDVYN